jgi:hypothetical protein
VRAVTVVFGPLALESHAVYPSEMRLPKHQGDAIMARNFTVFLVVFFAAAAAARPAPAAQRVTPAAIVAPAGKETSFAERLAAQEVRRYYYLRTGRLVPITESLDTQADGSLVVVGSKSRPAVTALLDDDGLKTAVQGLAAEQYLIRVLSLRGRPAVLIVGGDPTGTLYGAYRLAEQMGVRFYMHGDVIPDRPIPPDVDVSNESGKPLFDRRGIQPFHDFPEGPDWWSVDGYKAILGQLAKLRMNFFGLHTYPEGGVGPEPVVWIGRPEDIEYDVIVKHAYPSRHFTTANGTWGYQAMKTSRYCFGAAGMFDRDDYGVDYMRGMAPWPKTPEAQIELFNRMGGVLKDSFGWAHRLGVKTCVGTETPLVIPTPVKERLKAQGKSAADPAVVQEIYEGMFKRIMAAHPLDYYWFWTPENWTWEKVTQQQIDGTLSDFRAAMAAAKKVNAPFTLATCGWVLGPTQQPALFDNFLPKNMPMSCINRQVGHTPVEPGFAQVAGRPKWAIPWMEDDPALASVQLWAGRMRRDAADALAYGCTGLMGIHWRTRILAPNVAALAAAAWDQSSFNPAINKALPPPKLPEGPLGGQIAAYTNNRIAGTDDPPLYQTVRYNTGGYLFDVPNGAYTVTLKFCEPHYDKNLARVFGTKIQGKQVIDSLDIFATVGKNKALDRSFDNVQVTDGRLRIEFTYQIEFPCIAAIAVQGPVTRKINCGGPVYKDFQADWPPSDMGGKPDRYLPTADFYADWSRAEFGPEVADAAAAIFAKIDCRVPRPIDWTDGPGGIRPDAGPWDTVKKSYAFVDEFAKLQPQVAGAGQRERFHYWLSNFRYLRAAAHTNCTWARFNAAIAKVKAEKDPARQKQLARETALPIRKELIAQATETQRHLLATVTTAGEMGTVTNWQQHNFPVLLAQPGQELARLIGEPLPADAMPPAGCPGAEPHLFVPYVRTAMTAGEPLHLTAILVDGAAVRSPESAVVRSPDRTTSSTEGLQQREGDLRSGERRGQETRAERAANVILHWRPMGTGTLAEMPLRHVARGVYEITLPPEATKADLEYYVEATTDAGVTLCFPATAPTMSQTVVVVKGE